MGTKQEASKYLVILLQIVMMSRGTHLVKKHESQSRTIESQLKKNESLSVLITTQFKDRLQNSVLQFTEIKIYSFYCKEQRRLKEISII